MKHVKNTLKLFALDWKRIFKNPVATLLIIAVMIIPSLYAWFNIKALWDPYENTSQLPIAIYSADAGSDFQGKKIEIGDQVIDNLHKNDQLGLKFVSSKKALTDGVDSGKYYAGIYLPKEFSEDLLSFTSGEITKPKIEYYVNQKINAIAPKITDKGASSIQTTISDEFIDTASSTLMTVFNEVGFNLDSNLTSITKLTSLIQEVADNSDTINGYAQQVVDLNAKMPEIKQKLAAVDEFKAYLPQVDALTKKVVDLNDKFPEIKEKATIILTLEDKIPEIKNAAAQLAQVDSDFATIEKTMNDGINEAKMGLTVLDQVQTMMPDVQKLLTASSEAVTLGQDVVTKLQTDLPENLDAIVDSMVRVIEGATKNTAQIATNLAGLATEDNRGTIKSTLVSTEKLVSGQLSSLDNLSTILDYLEKNGASVDLIQAQVATTKTILTTLNTRLTQQIAQVDTADMATIKSGLTELAGLATQANTAISKVSGADVSEKIKVALTKTLNTLNVADNILTKAQAIDLDKFLSATKGTVRDAVTLLEKYQAELPAIKAELHDANTLLNSNLPAIVSGIQTGADLYRNELPTLETQLGKAATFIKNDWPGIEADLTKTLAMVDEKFPEVEKALAMASDLIKNDWPTLQAGVQKAADAIKKGEEDYDLSDIIKMLKLDANAESDFFSAPVELHTNDVYAVPNNGSASTPFYTALCLWVGAVLLSSIASTEMHLSKDEKKKYSTREKYSAHLLSFVVVGLAQALIVVLGNIFLLNVYAVSPGYSVLFTLLVALVFMVMVYVLVAMFGNVGKGLAIIILVLSISGGGGNYPIQLSGKFFQFINPLLPFTHAVNLLREPVGGIYWPTVWHAVIVLVSVMIGFLVIGFFVYPFVREPMKKLSEKSHESHFFH